MTAKPTLEQWKDRGICSWCRRNSYCRKQCSANREKVRKEIERRASILPFMTSLEDKNRFVFEAMKQKPLNFKRKILVHGAMIYGCPVCGVRWVMFLEQGLEDGSKNRKPVPFCITCPFCGDFHARDISGYLKLPDADVAELPEGEAFFENVPDSDCGKPRYPKFPPNEVIEGVHYSIKEREQRDS